MNNTLLLDRKKYSKESFKRLAVEELKKYGVIICRNFFNKNLLTSLDQEWKKQFNHPSISGSTGFSQTSYAKKTVSAFMLGKSALDVALNEDLVKIIEKYMGSPCTLAEANAIEDKSTSYQYFGLHSDFYNGWKKNKKMKKTIRDSDLKHPIGVGVIYYLHKTESGAFKYSIRSHKIQAKYGLKIEMYPEKVKEKILNNVNICIGNAGDLIIFDDRGFHGPDQPSNNERRVLNFDYYRDKTFGSVIVEPHKVKVNDLGTLSRKQQKVLGFHAKNLVEPEEYVYSRFKKNKLFGTLSWIVKHAYFFAHIKNLLKSKLGYNK